MGIRLVQVTIVHRQLMHHPDPITHLCIAIAGFAAPIVTRVARVLTPAAVTGVMFVFQLLGRPKDVRVTKIGKGNGLVHGR